ncbi:MAG: ComEA family DNA-binding protein [Armatimonadetes bacterium]|nr:ComEA family DNA-binding protein [Armatimonadota bacterium]
MFEMGRRQQLIVLAVVAVILFSAGYRYARWNAQHAEKPSVERSAPAEAAGQSAPEIVVHVTGAVEKPGVYRLPRGSRVNDALGQAGALPEADLDALNLAAPLADGQKIPVPFRQSALSGENAVSAGGAGGKAPGWPAAGAGAAAGGQGVRSSSAGTSGGGLININTASQKELESLPGIGPALAERIIQYREKNGPFLSPEDIKNVSGIGEKRYEQLKDLISVY